MQKITDELIEKFFKGLCTSEEAAMVSAYLKANPDHPYLMNEWEDADDITPLPEGYSEEMRQTVTDATMDTPVIRNSKRWWPMIAAACVLVSLVFLFFIGSRPSGVSEPIAKATPPQETWEEIANRQLKDSLVTLPDGSLITLYTGAAIRYKKEMLSGLRRDVYLTGIANFKVAKNKAKPFTVYSGDINTTALGTEFKVTAIPTASQLKVRLKEGKVLVKIKGAEDENYYLSPGEELTYDRIKKATVVQTFIKKKSSPPITGSVLDTPLQRVTESYVFNNQTLPEVLDQLAAIYHTRILYSRAELSHIFFIGKIGAEDSLEKVLGDIALLNKLRIVKQNGVYILKKKKH